EPYRLKPWFFMKTRSLAIPLLFLLAAAPALAQGPAPSWIWGAEIDKRYFLRKEFDGDAAKARLRATCDNKMIIFINDREVVQSDTWERPVEIDVQKYLKPGKNVIVAEVENRGGPAGFILKLTLTPERGRARYVVSDETWQAAEKKDAERWVA